MNWYNDIIEANPQNPSLPIIILGNKIDITSDRKVTNDTIQQFIQQFISTKPNNIVYYDISVKNNINCNEPFNWLFEQLN